MMGEGRRRSFLVAAEVEFVVILLEGAFGRAAAVSGAIFRKHSYLEAVISCGGSCLVGRAIFLWAPFGGKKGRVETSSR